MFTKSIRWRFLLWLAFLLACILTGFGVTAYHLYRTNQLSQIDETLKRRVAAVSADVRGRGRFGPPKGRPFDHGPDRPHPGFPAPEGEGPKGPRDFGPNGPPEMHPGPRPIHLSEQALSLFDETDIKAFYFAVWARGGMLLKTSTNSPSEMPLPERAESDTLTHVRMREAYREAYQFTELGDCVLAGRSIIGDLEAMHRFGGWLALAGGAVLALGLAGTQSP